MPADEARLLQALAEASQYLVYWCELWDEIDEFVDPNLTNQDGDLLKKHSQQIVRETQLRIHT